MLPLPFVISVVLSVAENGGRRPAWFICISRRSSACVWPESGLNGIAAGCSKRSYAASTPNFLVGRLGRGALGVDDIFLRRIAVPPLNGKDPQGFDEEQLRDGQERLAAVHRASSVAPRPSAGRHARSRVASRSGS